MVQGPPGTGKTLFIATLLGQLLKENPDCRILVSGQSHESVNNCIEKTLSVNPFLASSLNVIRLGDEAQLPSSLLEFSEQEVQDFYLNAFESEFDYRIKQSVGQIPVPVNAKSEIIELSRIIHKVHKLNLLTSNARHNENDSTIARRVGKLLRAAQMVIGQSADDHFSVRFEENERIDIAILKSDLADLIAEKYHLNDLHAIHKVFNVVSIAYEWCQSLRVSRRAFQEHLTSTRNLVCGTCVGIARSYYEMDESIFDWVIIDEAGRASFTELCIPMRYGKRIMLVGDERQLPPQIDNAVIDYIESGHKVYSREEIRKSDFERIIKTGYGQINTYQLLEQYRMSGSIGDLCSEVFYEGLLINKASILNADNVIEYQNHKLSGVTWIDTSGLGEESFEEKGESTSFINRLEAKIIIDIVVSTLHQQSHLSTTIGAICMYKDQVRLIEESMNNLRTCREALKSGRLEIGTVDSFQGREQDIVLLSLVRSNRENSAGFLKLANRINVAISRAKQHLLIIGNSRTATSQSPDSAIAKVFAYVSENSGRMDCNVIQAPSINSGTEEALL